MTNAFSTDYVPQLRQDTQRERAAASAGRKLSAINQAKLDAFGPATLPTIEQRRADEDRNRAIKAGRGI